MSKMMLKSDAAMMLLAEKDAHERTAVAARAMLSALQALLVECEKIETARCQSFVACDDARAAIDQAEAAGIKSS